MPQNYAEARKWYRLAADQGNADAQTLLGDMYANGRSVPQNYVEAHKWFNLAVSQLTAWASANVADANQGHEISEEM